MRQFMQIALFDIKMSFKQFIAAYVIAMPLVMVLVLRFFIPSVESTTGTIAVVHEGPNAVEEAVIERAATFAEIERYDSVEAVRTKLRAAGSAEGLYWDPEDERYVSLLERNVPENALFSAGARVVRRHVYETSYPDRERVTTLTFEVPAELSERTKNSPVATTGGAIFIAFMTMMTGFLVGLAVVRDKELGTDRALRVSPVTRTEYFTGKSVFPILVLAAYVFIGLGILGLLSVNLWQIAVVVIASVALVLLFGVVVGAFSKNETEALGLVKGLGTLAILGILAGLLLPEKWQWIVYWLPFYWVFNAADAILTLAATWTEVLWQMGVAAGICLVFFLGLRRRIAAGLS